MDPITMHARSPSGTSASRRARRPWADLLQDLLQDVSGRLHNVADNVRFHAVCRPWRRTSPLPLFHVASASCNGLILHSTVDSPRRLYYSPDVSRSSYGRSYSPFARFTGNQNWVASSDGTAAWFFTASSEPRLLNLVTGDVSLLPPLPDDEIMRSIEYSRGIIYGDGTIFLYSFVIDSRGFGWRSPTFTAAILHPADAAWTVMRKKLHVIGGHCTGATYHDGKVLVFSDAYKYLWYVLTPGYVDDGKDMEGGRLEPWMLGDVENRYFRDSYVLESHGELLWVTIFVNKNWRHVDADRDPTQAVSVKVHMLEGSNEDGNMRWVTMDGRSLSDRVFFLGSPASFTADVTELDANGGCVYFVFDRCVLRYSLVNSEAELVERLRPGWGSDKAHVWLRQ